MAHAPSIPGEVIVNIPFTCQPDGMVHATLTLDQFNLINRYITAHQKQMNASAMAMAKKKNMQGQVRAKLRYNLVLIKSETTANQETVTNSN